MNRYLKVVEGISDWQVTEASGNDRIEAVTIISRPIEVVPFYVDDQSQGHMVLTANTYSVFIPSVFVQRQRRVRFSENEEVTERRRWRLRVM